MKNDEMVVNVVVKDFPKATELNSVLYDRVCGNFQDIVRTSYDVGAHRTELNLHKQNFKEIDELTSWIKYILPDVSKKFAAKTEEDEFGFNFDVNSFEIASCWGIHFSGRESLIEHNHFPYALSFVYYVRTPVGTAPIIIEDEPHNVKEGQCIFFLASQYHSVDPNGCNGRCAIVGNILYKEKHERD